jgi:hypothetical protein
VICLAEGDPAGALGALRDVLDGTAPVIGYVTVVEAHLLAGLAHRELGDERAANQAAERALALAEADRLMLPFAMTGSRTLLEALPPHQTAHAALLADILDGRVQHPQRLVAIPRRPEDPVAGQLHRAVPGSAHAPRAKREGPAEFRSGFHHPLRRRRQARSRR